MLKRRLLAPLCALELLAPGGVLVAQEEASELGRLIRGRVEALRTVGEATAAGDVLLAREALPAFYESRGFEPVWVGPGGGGRALLGALRGAILQAADHGLDPNDYHLSALESLRPWNAVGSVSALTDLELLASDAFMVLGSHLLHGRVNPETIDPEWLANRRGASLDVVLSNAAATGRIGDSLFALAPSQQRYRQMLAAAAELRRTADGPGWPQIPGGPRLEEGVEDARVPALRSRLRASGDLVSESASDSLYDASLAGAVRVFQGRHGLDVDGVVGPATLAALNVAAEERVLQIETNLERWRWLPADLGERHVEVNIAGFDVAVVERGRTVRHHRAVVGRQYRQTPMFSGVMTYLVLAPYWHVPPTIAAVDKFPVISRDPSAIAAQRMTLLDQTTNASVDPASVDWASLTGASFNRRYRLRQDPGPYNALGDVKFMFPNRHNVYLHDTPTRELFGRSARDFSSGCIRIDAPLELAEYLLADQPEWTRARIESVIAAGVERTVRLSAGVPVHLLYWTAWADEDGTIHFRNDIYGRDRIVREGLASSPPGA